MHVVALVELVGPAETEAAALAADLGTTAYEERLKLAAGLPAIVLTSADPEPARALARKLRARGQGVVDCDAAEVVAAGRMVSMRRFAFEPDAVTLPDVADVTSARLPFADVLALFRAMHTTSTETRTETTTKAFSPGRAVLTGGLMMSKKVSTESKSQATARDQVLYVFRRSGQTPWILRERGTSYAGLGAQLGPSSAQNFMTVLGRLRAAAPEATYDERLLNARSAPTRAARSASVGTESLSVSSASGVDLLAHVMATWLAVGRPASPR